MKANPTMTALLASNAAFYSRTYHMLDRVCTPAAAGSRLGHFERVRRLPLPKPVAGGGTLATATSADLLLNIRNGINSRYAQRRLERLNRE